VANIYHTTGNNGHFVQNENTQQIGQFKSIITYVDKKIINIWILLLPFSLSRFPSKHITNEEIRLQMFSFFVVVVVVVVLVESYDKRSKRSGILPSYLYKATTRL
jgi:hypothetical protein